MKSAKNLIHKWHDVIDSDDLNMLDSILAEDAVFSSPVVFTPMEGKEITKMYLHAAGQSFNMEKFQYTKEIHDGMNSVLEFETYIDDISVNGVDMIEWNEDGKISNFKVMIRPFKAVQKVQEKMVEALESLSCSFFGLDSLTTNSLPSTSVPLSASIAASPPSLISTNQKPLERPVALSLIILAEVTVPIQQKHFLNLGLLIPKKYYQHIYSLVNPYVKKEILH